MSSGPVRRLKREELPKPVCLMRSDQPKLIDIHAHFVTEDYVAAVRAAGHESPDGMPSWPTWDPRAHLTLMDRLDIGMAVLSISSPGTHFGDDAAARILTRQVNEFGAKILREYPDRFGHFASLPLPDIDGALAEVAFALDALGCAGLAIETNVGGTYLGDPAIEPLWDELDRRGAIVFIQPTSPPCFGAVSLGRPRPMLEFIFESARTISDLLFASVLRRHPRVNWIVPHGGGALPLLADRMELFRTVFLQGSPDELTVQEQLRTLWFDMAGTPFPHQVPALVAAFGSDRLLYGSDYCFTPGTGVAAQVATIDESAQPRDDIWRALTTRNAQRLLRHASDSEADTSRYPNSCI